MNTDKLSLALAIISGRLNLRDLSHESLRELGYDSYRFRGYGHPSVDEIKLKAETIVLEMFQSLAYSANAASCLANGIKPD